MENNERFVLTIQTISVKHRLHKASHTFTISSVVFVVHQSDKEL